jgi:hypothetical protein
MRPLLLAATAALLFAAAPAPAQAQQAVGVVSALQNHVRVRKPRAPIPLPAALRQRIALGDEVHTGAKSQLQMLLLDQSVFTVGPNAQLAIDRFVYDPNRSVRSMGATVTRGAFRFMSGRRTTGSSTIKTPIAAIGIRGTAIDGVVGRVAMLIAAGERVGRGVRSDPATASLIVLRGPGPQTRGNVSPGAIDVTAGGRTVSAARPMLAIYIPGPGQAPIGPFVISSAGLMQLQAVLFPALAERLGLQPPFDPNAAPARPGVWAPDSPPPRRYPPLPGRGNFYPGPGDLNNDGPPQGVDPFPLGNLPGGQPQPARPQRPVTPPPQTPPAGAAPLNQADPVKPPATTAPSGGRSSGQKAKDPTPPAPR